MFIRLTVRSLDMEDSYSIDEGEKTRRLAVRMTVGYPDIRESITLDTGETFAHPRHQHFRENEDEGPIAFYALLLPVGDEDDYSLNKMRYHEEIVGTEPTLDYSPAFIHADCFIPPDQFDALVMNIRNGRYPTALGLEIKYEFFTIRSTVDIQRQSGSGRGDDRPMEFGSAPDGTKLIWHTKEKKNRAVDIIGVGFHYNLVQPAEDMDLDDLQSARPDPAATAARMEKQLQEVTNHLANISKILAVGMGIAIVVAIIATWN